MGFIGERSEIGEGEEEWVGDAFDEAGDDGGSLRGGEAVEWLEFLVG